MNRTGGHTHLWSEHHKEWLRDSYSAYTYIVPPNPNQWIKLVYILYFMWDTGSILAELEWTVLVLVTNINSDTQEIGLLEIVYKVLEVVIDTRVNAIVQLHYVFHGFHGGRLTGTNIMELKILQDLASVDQDPLFLVFLDLRKVCNNLDGERLLQNL